MVGIVTPEQANNMARETGLDLVEISPNTNPHVCKILDYGKYIYEKQKLEKKNLSNFIVIGRPIYQNKDPYKIVCDILDEINRVN